MMLTIAGTESTMSYKPNNSGDYTRPIHIAEQGTRVKIVAVCPYSSMDRVPAPGAEGRSSNLRRGTLYSP
jgi:hypothetical protein